MTCYLCGGESLSILTDKLRNGPGRVLYCKSCHIGMLEDRPVDLSQYYEEEYRKTHGPSLDRQSDYEDLFESYVNYQTERVRLLQPFLGSDTRLLEVGCSVGQFLYNVKDKVSEVVGVDYDAGAAEFAGKVCNCRTYRGDLEDSGLPEESFDLVCAMQTLEHVPDPIGFARTLGKYVKPGGRVYVEVPSLLDPLLWLYDVPAYRPFYFHEAHLFYLEPTSLSEIMTRAGFSGEVVHLQDYGLFNHLYWHATGRPQRSCHEGLGAPRLPFHAGRKPELCEKLESLLTRVNAEYKKLLAQYGATSNIAYLGLRDCNSAPQDLSKQL